MSNIRHIRLYFLGNLITLITGKLEGTFKIQLLKITSFFSTVQDLESTEFN